MYIRWVILVEVVDVACRRSWSSRDLVIVSVRSLSVFDFRMSFQQVVNKLAGARKSFNFKELDWLLTITPHDEVANFSEDLTPVYFNVEEVDTGF